MEEIVPSKIYMDCCCFNRPYDDQSNIRIRLETEAKLKDPGRGSRGPFDLGIEKWRECAQADVEEDGEVLRIARMIGEAGIKKIDSLHVACAIRARADYFLTTDDGILLKARLVPGIKIDDPFGFIKEVFA